MPVKLRALPVLLLCLLSLAARADDCRPAGADFSPAAALDNHQRREAACHRDADFLRRLGTLLNLAGRYAEAADRLEAALLRAPDDPRIQLEYAIALAGSGDETAAASLLAQLRRDPALGGDTLRQLDQLLDTARWRARLPGGSLALVVGHDDNLLGAARQGPFDLTLPYGNLTVEPAADQQPRPGHFIRADLRLDGIVPLAAPVAADPPRWGLFASQRKTPGQPADRLHWGFMLEKNNTWIPGDYLQLTGQQLSLESVALYRQIHAGVGLSAPLSIPFAAGLACRRRIGLEGQRRDYPQAAALAGDYAGLQLQALCPESGLQLALRLGSDRPRRDGRPGGAQDQAALRAGYRSPIGRGILNLEAEWSWQRDAAGYSPLLENNRARQLRRGIYRLEYRWAAPVFAPLHPFVSLEWLDQRANLPLFSLQNGVAAFGLSLAW